MNIVVCIKTVPGTITGLSIAQNQKQLDPVVRSYCINETDEYAIDEALALRNLLGGQVTVLSVGPISFEEKLQVAVAKGADRAIRIAAPAYDPGSVSAALAEAIRGLKHDLVLCGLESSDHLGAQVGVATAARLGIPFLFAATKIEVAAGSRTARVTKELGNSAFEVLEVDLPALIAIQTGIQKLTYAPVAKLLQAKRRGIDCQKAAELPPAEAQKARTGEYLELSQPRRKRSAKYLEGAPSEIAAEIAKQIAEAKKA